MKIKLITFGLLIILIFLAGCSSVVETSPTKTSKSLNPSELASGIQTTSDGTKYLVDPKKIRGGGPGKGGIGTDKGIPALALNNIKFVTVQEADEWIEDNELVLALVYKGVEKVYPLQILVWHEIANDVVGGDPLAVTYCPLCGSGIAYDRRIEVNGELTETRFGTSGKLFNSNLIMYDETTETYWQQIDGNAIVGELTGQELKEISVDTVTWREWKSTHPNSQVLSQETGIRRSYGRDPYGNYYEDSFLIFPVENEDNRIHPKTPILGIEINNQYKAYKRKDIVGTIEDEFAGTKIKLEKLNDGRVQITNLITNQEIVKEEDFWFAWYAFHPETELYNG
jgi:hypothetical protein